MGKGTDSNYYDIADLEGMVLAAQQGDVRAKEEVCHRFRPLVYSQAARGYARGHYEDALSEGWAGLLEAIEGYDASFGVKFPGFAESKVRSSIWGYCRKEWQSEARYPLCDKEVLDRVPDEVKVEDKAAFEVQLSSLEKKLDFRQCYVLKRVILEGATLKQTGKELGISLEAVYRTKQKLIKVFTREYGKECVLHCTGRQ